jgi:hypothetical protein
MQRKNTFSLSAVVAGVLLAAAAPSFAGEALPEELPSMRTPVADYVPDGVTSRQEVRAQLMESRRNGSLQRAGEAGDTDRVLAARDQANEEQAAQITAQYEAEAAAQVAMAEAERQRQEIENEGQFAALSGVPSTEDSELAMSEGIDSYEVPPLVASIDSGR